MGWLGLAALIVSLFDNLKQFPEVRTVAGYSLGKGYGSASGLLTEKRQA